MSELSKVTTVILAGGLGTRLRKVVSDRPKVLAEVQGKPFLCYILDQLVNFGINQVIISAGYLADKIISVIGSKYDSLNLNYSKEVNPLGTAGALRLIHEITDERYCLVMNGDSYIEFDLLSLFNFFRKRKAKIVILTKMVADTSRYGTIQMNEKNEITAFVEKKKIVESGIINAGIYLMKTSTLINIPNKTPCSLEYDFFPRMIDKGMYGYIEEGRFIDIGTPNSYVQAQNFF